MFVREKRIGAYTYVYLVETVREDGKIKQRIIRNLGRKEAVEAAGDLDRLARSATRLSQRSMILSLIEGGSAPDLTCRRIGASLLFERLWQESGCRAVVEDLLRGRRFEFPVERAIFLTVLHRLMVSGSDRACEHWRDDYRIDGIDKLDLHHLYRAMSWLGEELSNSEQQARTLAPRCIKDLVEEKLFERRRDLFSELSVVFMDTTTLYFEGRGGGTLGEKGKSKDYRPHLNQMVLGIIMDQDGRPVCSEMWPGNTADVTTLLPVIDRLRRRFAIGRICVVADRGMISTATIAGLEERKLDYILGVRERNSKEVSEFVLNDRKSFVPLHIPRDRRDTELEAKNVFVGERRYVVCRNLAEAKRDAEVREAVLRSLRSHLARGDKTLIGNSAYRRYLKTPDDKHFEIDEKRVAADARYDGLYVLRTNMRLDALAVMLRYRELLEVEDIFRTTKSILDTRPIYHQTDEAIRGHVFCSFLALVLRKLLEGHLVAARLKPEWGALLRELDRLQEVETEQDGKQFILRTPVTGDVGRVFKAVGVALPPNIREVRPAEPAGVPE
jgi:Transposase DDE domain